MHGVLMHYSVEGCNSRQQNNEWLVAVACTVQRQSPQFSAHVYCGQTAAWIKLALGMEVALSPGHIVLDGDSAPPPPKRGHIPNFRPISVVAKRLDTSRIHLVWR